MVNQKVLGGILALLLLLVLICLHQVDGFSAASSTPSSRRGGNRRRGGKSETGGGKKESSESGESSSSGNKSPRVLSASHAKTAREAAYLAALGAERGQKFISDALDEWSQTMKPTSSEMGLATLIASVACREALSLDHALKELAGGGPIKLKAKQKVLLRTALAQYKYCTRIPVYAVVNSAVELAKRYGGGASFGRFTNAVLRKLSSFKEADDAESSIRPLPLPTGDSIEALSTIWSYPPFLVELFMHDYGLDVTRQILEAGNLFPPTMVRSRSQHASALPDIIDDENENGTEEVTLRHRNALEVIDPSKHLLASLGSKPLPYLLGIVRSERLLRVLTKNADWYITNGTPAGLIGRLAEGVVDRMGEAINRRPLRVLDLCSAPGGKGLAVWDVVKRGQGKDTELTMNDVSEEKVDLIRENLHRFGLFPSAESNEGEGVNVVVNDGIDMKPPVDGGYDVVIVDAPCSNAGVLSRRPEARWRLANKKLIEDLEVMQLSLIGNAVKLLAPDNPRAEIWYMTCSILSREDNGMVEKACKDFHLGVARDEDNEPLVMRILPGEGLEGAFDGGFAACLVRQQASSSS